MKKIIILFLIAATFSCKAQQHIVNISSKVDVEYTPNYYLKDIDNEFNKYIGTWKYINGNTSFTISLDKEIKYQLSESDNFEDIIIGEYQYIENGIEKVNTLNRINDSSVKGYNHNINGNIIMDNWGRPQCNTCAPNERRIRAIINHPTDENTTHTITLRYINTGGIEKIEFKIYGSSADVILLAEGEPDPLDLPVPMGTYILTKQ